MSETQTVPTYDGPVSVTRYSGGDELGPMIQITLPGGAYVRVRPVEFAYIASCGFDPEFRQAYRLAAIIQYGAVFADLVRRITGSDDG